MEMFATIAKETEKAYFVSFQTRSHHAEYPIVREFVLQAEQMWMPKSVVVAQTATTITVAAWFLKTQLTLRLAYTPAHAAEDAAEAAKMAAITAKYAVVSPVTEAEAVEKEMTLEEIEVVLYGSVDAANVAASTATMNTYTIQTTNEELTNNYSGFGEWEYRGRSNRISNRVAAEVYTVTIPAGRMAAFEQLLDTDDSVLSYTETATGSLRAAIAEGDWATVYALVCAAGAVDFSQANGESNLGEWLAGGSYDGNETAEQLAAEYAADDAWQQDTTDEA